MVTMTWLSAAVLAQACGDETTVSTPDPPRATTLTVTPASARLTALGTAVQFSPRVLDQYGGDVMAGAAVSWTTSDASVARVDASGLVTATGNGTSAITAVVGEVSGTATATVAQEVGMVAVSPERATLVVGDTLSLVARAVDANGHAVAGAEVAWSSSDVAVAEVDGSGIVRGVGLGTATITAASNGAEGPSEITVDNPDRRVLVALYMATDGPNWVNNDGWMSDAPLGEWYGVTTDASGRVVQIDLSGDNEDRGYTPHGLSGPIPPEVGNLTHLEQLRLDENALIGPIPPEVGKLSKLESLRLDLNGLTRIPPEIGKLSNLTELDLSWNNLSGVIPSEIGRLSNLTELNLSVNKLGGVIPSEIGRLSKLTSLALYRNALSGPIPTELGNLSNLKSLWLRWNNLSGPIPTEIGNLSDLTGLSLSRNSLSGRIPTELGDLSNLTTLLLGENDLSGPVPQSLLQIDGLLRLRLSDNSALCIPATPAFRAWLAGIEDHDIEPGNDCNAVDVAVLESLYEVAGGAGWTKSDGWLGDEPVAEWHGIVADTLGRVTQLDLEHNGLAGFLPGTLGDLAALTELRVSHNALAGRVPLSLKRTRLEVLRYADTNLCVSLEESFQAWLNTIGSVSGARDGCGPDRKILETFYEATEGPNWDRSTNWLTDTPLGEWYGVEADDQGRVRVLHLGWNGLSGPIPPELGGLSNLTKLWLRGIGPIPPEIGNLSKLTELSLGGTFGPIPPEIGKLSKLRDLQLSGSGIFGPIPPEIASLSNLTSLWISGSLTGPIPPWMGSLSNLTRLVLRGRSGLSDGSGLTGSIPSEIGDLADLRILGLGQNQFASPIPPELGNLSRLRQLWLESNDLTGPVPSGMSGLSDLEVLVLTNNPKMAGPLPADLTELNKLRLLRAENTGLCAPSYANFQRWLRWIDDRRIRSCIQGVSPAAYLVQAVQSSEFPVPLVAGERALLRVFPTANQATTAGIPEVRVRFYRDGRETHAESIRGSSTQIPTHVDESSLAGSANAEIPGDVVQPGLEMVIDIDPGETLDPALLVTKRIPETGRLAVEVHAMPLFHLTLIPFVWTQTQDSSRVDLIEAVEADPENHRMIQATRTLLPIGDMKVTGHDPVLSSSNDARTLLSETAAIRRLEGGAGYYMGILPPRFSGDAAGVALLSGVVSVATADPFTIAHELGHNLSLNHAPCGGPLRAGWYPYPDGSIGTWGYDFVNGGTVVPSSHKDLMSYCGPPWISDYHFTKALGFRLRDARSVALPGPSVATMPSRSILLWGGTGPDGVPYLEPAFLVDAPAALPSSRGDHRVTGRTGREVELFSFSFDMREVADGGGNSSFAFVLPVRSGWEGNLDNITLTGPAGSVTLDGESDIPMAIVYDPRSGQVRGILRDLPPPSQAALDATGRATSQGLEVLFSRGIPDAAAWRR